MINKKRNRSESIRQKEENSSSSSEKYIISSPDNSFKICKIENRKAFSDTLKKLKNPFTILDEEIISEFNIKSKYLKEGESFEHIVDFSTIQTEKILFLNNEEKINDFYNNKQNKIIFSSFENDNKNKEDKEDVELVLFEKLTNFINNIEKECYISDFCPEYLSLFENNSIEKYYKSIRRPRSYTFRYHLSIDNKNITKVLMKLFGPRNISKSIYLRSVLANYHMKYKIFRPTLIFDVSFINNNIGANPQKFRKIFYHELFSLFSDIYDVDEFYQKIDFLICDTMTFINNVIELYLKYMEENRLAITKNIKHSKPLFCIDNYSYFYDPNNFLEKIEYSFKIQNKYNLYIIYSIIENKDQIEFVKYCRNDIELNPLPGKNIFNFCYNPSFRNLSEFENSLVKDNINIPAEYKKIFGENVYFLFKFIKTGIEFEKFIKKEENGIRDEIAYFYHQIDNKKLILENIIKLIDEKKEIEYDKEILVNIPSNYIIINRKKAKTSDNYTYSFEYSFPLIKKILKNMLKNAFFIDINNPLFLKLNEAAMGINFDEFMNFFFQNENSFFGYYDDEIEKAYDEYCLEKSSVNEDNEQLFLFSDVIDVLKENKSENFLKLEKKYKNRDLIKNKKVIIVFQKFFGKFVDILFIVKKENMPEYSIVNLQIKLSDSYKVSKKAKNLQKYQMTYLKEKYQYIFGIKIVDSYIIYLSLFELKKKFAENNKDIFIYYSKDINKLVDIDKKVLEKFPFLINGKVELISEYDAFIYSSMKMLEHYTKMKFECIKIDKKVTENVMKIDISQKEIKVEIQFMNEKYVQIIPNKNGLDQEISYYRIVKIEN